LIGGSKTIFLIYRFLVAHAFRKTFLGKEMPYRGWRFWGKIYKDNRHFHVKNGVLEGVLA
jgi:hypothetical protein